MKPPPSISIRPARVAPDSPNLVTCENCKRRIKYAWFLTIAGFSRMLCNRCRDKVALVVEESTRNTAEQAWRDRRNPR